mgnify:CR=1 FL=1
MMVWLDHYGGNNDKDYGLAASDSNGELIEENDYLGFLTFSASHDKPIEYLNWPFKQFLISYNHSYNPAEN